MVYVFCLLPIRALDVLQPERYTKRPRCMCLMCRMLGDA